MELRDYLKVVRRRWMLIVVITAFAAIAASLYVMNTPKKYASSATLFVSTSPADGANGNAVYQGGLYSEARVQSYVDIANGSGLAQQVVDSLNLDMTASQLSSEINASTKANTVLLTVTITDRDPKRALLINQRVVGQLEQTIAQIETPPGQKLPLLKATLVNPARFSASPVSPRVSSDIGLGVVLGLLLGFGIAVAREILDSTVKDLRDVHGFSEVPVIAAFPLDPAVSSEPLISSLDRQSPRAEAFRVLRTNIQFLSVDSHSKIYVVSSSIPGEGKSTTVTNLAIALAQGGKRVLLVDGDLRRPRVADLLGLVPNVGLTTALVGELSLRDCLQVHSDSGLAVLTAGKVPPNPAELLQSHAMADLLAQLREQFDVILVDAPPLLPVTDAALLGNEADGVLLMVRHSKTTKDQLQGAAHRLESVDANLAGVIFNMVPRRAGAGSSGYGYGYGYGYASETLPNKRNLWRRGAKTGETSEFDLKAIALTGPVGSDEAGVSSGSTSGGVSSGSTSDGSTSAGVSSGSTSSGSTSSGSTSGGSTSEAEMQDDLSLRDRQAAPAMAHEHETSGHVRREFSQRTPLKVEDPPSTASTSDESVSTPGRRIAPRAEGPLNRRRRRPTL